MRLVFGILITILSVGVQAITPTDRLFKAFPSQFRQAVFESPEAGQTISTEDVELWGVDLYFSSHEISDKILRRIEGRSYKKGAKIPLGDLRYLRVLHYNFEGEIQIGELICNQAIEEDLLAIFRTLYRHRYPIERMVLIDEYEASDALSMEANNTSAFNYRTIRNTDRLSRHSWGLAIDINPRYNPCVTHRKDGTEVVEPECGRAYSDRSRDFDHKIDHEDLCYKEFKKHGFIWGGDWHSLKDYQHFEKRLPK